MQSANEMALASQPLGAVAIINNKNREAQKR